MNCLKSFTIHSSSSISGVGTKIWVQNLNNYWVVDQNVTSQFDIQGFKNVNIHGVELTGFLDSQIATSNNCIINDWSTLIQLQGGTIPQISGQIAPPPVSNQWFIDNTSGFARLVSLGKFNQKITFASPFESVKSIRFLNFQANGIGAESLTTISLKWQLQWVFYYTYEGEQY
jgi:hypothetical protein